MDNHCHDCCCARSWTALRVTQFDGKSIPEHIDDLRRVLADTVAEVGRLKREVDIVKNAHRVCLDQRDRAEAQRDELAKLLRQVKAWRYADTNKTLLYAIEDALDRIERTKP